MGSTIVPNSLKEILIFTFLNSPYVCKIKDGGWIKEFKYDIALSFLGEDRS